MYIKTNFRSKKIIDDIANVLKVTEDLLMEGGNMIRVFNSPVLVVV